MPKIVSLNINMDSVVSILKKFADPSVIEIITSAPGAEGVAALAKYGPYVGVLGQLAEKFFPGSTDRLSRPGLPDTGPKGRGRLKYLRKRKFYQDDQIVDAVSKILSPESDLPGRDDVTDEVEYTLGAMFHELTEYNDHHKRQAIDHILENDGLDDATADKFGDMIWFILNPPKQAQVKVSEEAISEQPVRADGEDEPT